MSWIERVVNKQTICKLLEIAFTFFEGFKWNYVEKNWIYLQEMQLKASIPLFVDESTHFLVWTKGACTLQRVAYGPLYLCC